MWYVEGPDEVHRLYASGPDHHSERLCLTIREHCPSLVIVESFDSFASCARHDVQVVLTEAIHNVILQIGREIAQQLRRGFNNLDVDLVSQLGVPSLDILGTKLMQLASEFDRSRATTNDDEGEKTFPFVWSYVRAGCTFEAFTEARPDVSGVPQVLEEKDIVLLTESWCLKCSTPHSTGYHQVIILMSKLFFSKIIRA